MVGLRETESGRAIASLLGMSVDGDIGEGSSSTMASNDENESKRVPAAVIDRISALPLEISHDIMACLPIVDAVRMSSMSKKWLHTWTSLPKLAFDMNLIMYLYRTMQTQEFLPILNKVILSHEGPISSFYIYIPFSRTSVSPFIRLVIFYLALKNVKRLVIINVNRVYTKMSPDLFSCLELETLDLMAGFTLDLSHSFEGFRNLVNLRLEKIIFTGSSFNEFIKSCPLLELLILAQWEGFMVVDLVAPKLKILSVSGVFEALFLDGAPNLMSVSISQEELWLEQDLATTRRLMKQLTMPSKIESLTIGGYFFRFLVSGGIESMLPLMFRTIKTLEFLDVESDNYDEFVCMIWILKGCPNVEKLTISFGSREPVEHNITFDHSHPLVHLREVEVAKVLGYSMEVKLIKFLILCSPALQELCIESSPEITPILESEMTKELLHFPRTSPTAQVIFDKPPF